MFADVPVHPEFQLNPAVVYLNHAAVAPWPLRTVEAVTAFARENLEFGARHYGRWMETEKQLRERLQKLINAPSPEDISLLKNTSEALSVVAYGIDWRPGDNVVTFRQEFPSNRIVWESLRHLGVETLLVDLQAGDSPEEELLSRCNHRTRLISTSSVQYASGLRIDLEALGAYTRKSGILFCVDAIQSLGAIPFDVEKCQADFVVADGHKWMLGPEGIALLYTRKEIRNSLRLNQFGWHMLSAPGDYERMDWAPSRTGTRFECGSPNMLGIHALNSSLSLLLETGIEAVYQQILDNTDLLVKLMEKHANRFELITDRSATRRSGIVTIRIGDLDQEKVLKQLIGSGVICAYRGGGIRFSPHFYTTSADIERAWDRLLAIVK